jgi:hypothetical protein
MRLTGGDKAISRQVPVHGGADAVYRLPVNAYDLIPGLNSGVPGSIDDYDGVWPGKVWLERKEPEVFEQFFRRPTRQCLAVLAMQFGNDECDLLIKLQHGERLLLQGSPYTVENDTHPFGRLMGIQAWGSALERLAQVIEICGHSRRAEQAAGFGFL